MGNRHGAVDVHPVLGAKEALHLMFVHYCIIVVASFGNFIASGTFRASVPCSDVSSQVLVPF
jgi:hypothetical protein